MVRRFCAASILLRPLDRFDVGAFLVVHVDFSGNTDGLSFGSD